MEGQWNANEREVAEIKAISSSKSDNPVLMININKYNDGEYPNSETYWHYMKILPKILDEWELKSFGNYQRWASPLDRRPLTKC